MLLVFLEFFEFVWEFIMKGSKIGFLEDEVVESEL